jgi:hypothetical protein
MFLNDGRLGDNHVLEAIVNMKESKGSDKAAIATYIEVFLLYFVCVCLSFYVQSHLAGNNLLFPPHYNVVHPKKHNAINHTMHMLQILSLKVTCDLGLEYNACLHT